MPNLLIPPTIKFSLPLPTIDDSVLTGKIDGSLAWTSQNTLLYKPIDNVIYVSKNGKDTNTGKSLITAKNSIKSALSAATSGTTIIITSGVYVENTPLTCPPDVTITSQDSFVQIKSTVDSNNIFYLNSGTIIDGLTIINTRATSFAFSLKPNTRIIKAPVIKNCSIITGPFLNDNTLFVPNQTIQIQGTSPTNLPIINNDLVPTQKRINESGAGNGILIDGAMFSSDSIEKLVIVESCNIFSQGGIGILVKNSAKCYATGCITKFCNLAYKTESGGELILNYCNSSYGNYALYSDGIDPNVITTGTIEEVTVYPETGLIGQIKVNNLSKQPITGTIIEINNERYQISNATTLLSGSSYVSIMSNLTELDTGIEITIYNNSRIIANNHTFNYVGSGVTYNALAENNGQANDNNRITNVNFGSVYYSSNNEAGIFEIGDLFKVNQITGEVTATPTIESLANVSSIGPFIRNGVPVGTQVREISNSNELISSTGTIDQYTIPTQTAIYNYLNNNYLPITGGNITGSTTIQDIKITNNEISSVESNQNIKIAPNGLGSIDANLSNIINLAAPINDNDAATRKFVVDLIQGGITLPSIIPIIWGSNENNGTLTLRSTQATTKPVAGVILDDNIPSTSTITGTLVVRGGVGIDGALNAKTKSFDIEHPLDTKKRLRYGSLESPYHGIRLTGKDVVINGKCVVKLPDYIKKLVREENVNIQLTNFNHDKILWVNSIDIQNNQFIVESNETANEYHFFWSFTAIRNDVDNLVVEYVSL